MLSFLILVICMLAACLAFLVWSFWPVLHGKDFTRFERDVEEQERREFQASIVRDYDKDFRRSGRAFVTYLARRNGSY